MGGISCDIGHVICACWWYVFIIAMTYFAALSMFIVVLFIEKVSSCRQSDVFSRADSVLASPIWQRCIRGLGMGSMKGGWSLVVGM